MTAPAWDQPELPDEPWSPPIVEQELDPGPHPRRTTGDDELRYAAVEDVDELAL